MAADRMNWGHHADHDLLTAITQELQPTQEQLRGVMARMHEMGYTCTVKAITYYFHFHFHFLFAQHLQKLRRKDGGAVAGGAESAPSASGTPKTPRKRSATSTPAKKTSAKRKAKKQDSEGEDDEECDNKTPSKKVKKEEPLSDQELPPNDFSDAA
ncbi:hypothetical protein B0T24DRAFT_680488 [Lasiosphaeria ovina]|uniref:Uncharacterized protein n=1 Tax=Lasiosphaeria ovina TaxID=92902 RepID=A0AAE0K8L3_9PEZI|nr:hypothetical protein B0T24DRAFT_680488 [Lasiosphaeria ovina]